MRFILPLSVLMLTFLHLNAVSEVPDDSVPEPGDVYQQPFDAIKDGELPAGWKAEATNPEGTLPDWKIVPGDDASGKPSVLSVTKKGRSDEHSNLFWTQYIQFQDGTLEVKIRADAGQQDQGGGLIWRAVDAQNYYVARYNPLEGRFSVACVNDGKSTELADAERLKVKTGDWFTMTILIDGEKIEGWLDGKKLLEVSDTTYTEAGGVGLWINADAASSFYDFKAEPAEKIPAVLNFTVKTLSGQDVSLTRYSGKVLLIVNVASRCGRTPQYKDLQALHEKYADKGLAILGFPCNQFGGQEPGSDLDIQSFCRLNYGVTFDMFSKIDVNGENASPLYRYLTSQELPIADKGPVRWNFEKFLIDRQGRVVARYRSGVSPSSREVVEAVEAALAE